MYIAYTAIYVYNHSYTNNLSRDWPHLLNLDCLHQHHQPEKSTEDIFLKLPATRTHTKTNAQKKKKSPQTHAHTSHLNSFSLSTVLSTGSINCVMPSECKFSPGNITSSAVKSLVSCHPVCILCTMHAALHQSTEPIGAVSELANKKWPVLGGGGGE